MNAPRRPRRPAEPIDPAPPHEVAVELYAAHHAGVLGPETLHVIQIHARRAAEAHDRPGDGLAVALHHLYDVGQVSTLELARLTGKSRAWADELIRVGRGLAGERPRRSGRPRRAAG